MCCFFKNNLIKKPSLPADKFLKDFRNSTLKVTELANTFLDGTNELSLKLPILKCVLWSQCKKKVQKNPVLVKFARNPCF